LILENPLSGLRTAGLALLESNKKFYTYSNLTIDKNMLSLQPDLLLSKELQISYPPDHFEWIKSNLHGLRYITFKETKGRNIYEPQCCKISVNMSATPTSLPEEKASEIIEKVYLVLQYFRDAEDRDIKFCVTCYCKTTTGADKPNAKHIVVGNSNTGETESKFFNPNKIDGDMVDAQMGYINQLQDYNGSLMGMMVGVLGQSLEANKEKDKLIRELGYHQVEIEKIRLLAESEKEEQKIRLLIEKDKVQANKEKWENTIKQLNKNGALDRVMEIGSQKLFGMISGNEEIKQPVKKKVQVRKPNEEEQEKLKQEQDMQIIEEGLKVAPLFTHCVMLKNSLAQDEMENGNDSVNKYIENELPSGMAKDFQDLLNSENESEAKTNLKNMHSNISEEDFPKLLFLRSRMNETQKKIITVILKFLEEDNNEE
jgi:hypothetical protein